MSRLRVHGFAISLDGYGAGPGQDLENPMGRGGMALHQWAFPTRFFHAMQGKEGGTEGPDDAAIRRGFDGIGAWILGRNMFGPIRGGWGDLSWRGWWGEEPPYRCPVFVLTHHPRESLAMRGGTVFHFVTDGIEAALNRAREAAGGKDVRLGGGVSTLRQYLAAGLVDEMEFAIAPVMLGGGEAVFAGLDLPALGYRHATWAPPGLAAHARIARE